MVISVNTALWRAWPGFVSSNISPKTLLMNLLEKYRFKRDVFRLFDQHQVELVTDNGIEVEMRPDADRTVYALSYNYCCEHNLHLSVIQKIRNYFKQWYDDLEIDRTMRIW